MVWQVVGEGVGGRIKKSVPLYLLARNIPCEFRGFGDFGEGGNGVGGFSYLKVRHAFRWRELAALPSVLGCWESSVPVGEKFVE